MSSKSALEEYYLFRMGISPTPTKRRKSDCDKEETTNEELRELLVRMRNEHSEHLREQDLLLDIIKNQSKPNFRREFLANLSANAVWDGTLFILGKLGKCIKL